MVLAMRDRPRVDSFLFISFVLFCFFLYSLLSLFIPFAVSFSLAVVLLASFVVCMFCLVF